MQKSVGPVLVLALLSFGSWGIYTIEFEKKTYYQKLDTALKEKATIDYLDAKIITAIENDKIDDAVMYQHLAEYLGIRLNGKTLKKIEENNTLFSRSWRNTKHFGTGFLSGQSEDMAGLSGSIVSDMTLYGDLRDLSVEGSKFVQNEPYDKVIFGMAVIGVGLTASQFFTLGSTTPAKMGASIVKVAKKTGKLSKPFVDIVSTKLAKAINFDRLKKIDYTSMDSVKKGTKYISKSLDMPFIRKAFKNIDSVKKNTGSYADTISLLKYIDKPKDLQRMANVSKKYKTNTKAIFKVLGKGTIKGLAKGGAKIIKWTSMLVAQVISFAIALFSLILFIRKIIGIGVRKTVSLGGYGVRLFVAIVSLSFVGIKTILSHLYRELMKLLF